MALNVCQLFNNLIINSINLDLGLGFHLSRVQLEFLIKIIVCTVVFCSLIGRIKKANKNDPN